MVVFGGSRTFHWVHTDHLIKVMKTKPPGYYPAHPGTSGHCNIGARCGALRGCVVGKSCHEHSLIDTKGVVSGVAVV